MPAATDRLTAAGGSALALAPWLAAAGAAAAAAVLCSHGCSLPPGQQVLAAPQRSEETRRAPENAAVIRAHLATFEAENDCRVVFAAECSSRIFGTSHAGSDHDVCVRAAAQLNALY